MLNFGKALEGAAPDHLHDLPAAAKTIFVEALHDVRHVMLRIGFARILECRGRCRSRLAASAPRKTKLDMDGERHIEIHHCRPKTIVLLGWIWIAGRKMVESHRLEADLRAMHQLANGVVDIRNRNDTDADQPLRGERAILLGEPIIVSAHYRFVRLVIADAAPKARPNVAVK